MSKPSKPWWARVMPYLIVIVAVLVIGGHVALWLSDTPREVALRLTLLNAAGWAVVILPAWGVSRWLKHRVPDRDEPEG